MPGVQSAIATAEVLHDLESGNLFQDEKQDEDAPWYSQFGLVTLLTMGLGVASLVMNILAMAFYQTAVVLVMGIVAVILAPIVVKRQVDMEDKGGLRQVHNKLRETVNVLSQENTRLCGQVNQFAKQVKSLKHCESELGVIADQNSQDVNTLVTLVKDNGEILRQLEEAVLAQAIQGVFDVFLDCDRDESSSLDEKEIKYLSVRLSKMEGVTINQTLLEEKVKQDSSMVGIMAMLQASAKPGVPPENKVFVFQQNQQQ